MSDRRTDTMNFTECMDAAMVAFRSEFPIDNSALLAKFETAKFNARVSGWIAQRNAMVFIAVFAFAVLPLIAR